jgi:hypothetical protein
LPGFAAGFLGAAALSVVATFVLRYEVGTAGPERHRAHLIDDWVLDEPARQSLCSAQRAVRAVLSSRVHQEGLLDAAVGAATLRRHEWEIASRLRDLTASRAECARSMSEGLPGPRSEAVLTAHRRAISIAETAVTTRVEELRRYAREVGAADAALRDWRTAEVLARRNDWYLDLVARSEADEQALAEVRCLIEQAVRTRDVFQATLDQTTLAAQPLVLPAGRHDTDEVAGPQHAHPGRPVPGR